MGIFMYMCISKSVTRSEWKKVYEETLQLVKAFPLAEKRKINCKGFDTVCLVPTVEREEIYGLNKEKRRMGWFADGDYESLHIAEEYYLYRELVQDGEVEINAGDALLGALPAYTSYDWEDPICSHTYHMWGNKTQGEPYHMYLLAVACLIMDRLGNKAFVYGDITRGQCMKAVEMANQHLTKPINIPDRCDMDRFYKRVSKLPMSEKEQIDIFDKLYLGTKNSTYGEYIREKYSEAALHDYWRDVFEQCYIGTIGFTNDIKKYFAYGFDLTSLCRLVNYNDKDNTPQYEKFIRSVMDTKIYIKNKNCKDILEIDQEESAPYSIYTLMAKFAFAGFKNKKVDRYIPIEEVKQVLIDELGDKCEVENIIDEYLHKETQEQKNKVSQTEEGVQSQALCEQDESDIFTQIMDIKRDRMTEQRKKYDITTQEDLMYYEAGDSIEPNLQIALKQSFAFYNSVAEEEQCKELMEQSASIRCQWLIDRNRFILIRDEDWNKIFADIQENKNSFLRYYPMVRLKLDSGELRYMAIAIVTNDELYDYCKGIIEE